MKNLFYLLTVVCFFATFTLTAQTTPMTKGTNVAMIGVGAGGYGHTYYSTVSPTIVATFQRGIVDDLGPGNLSVGGTLAHKSGRYNGVWTDYKSSWFAISGRASYHPHFVKSEKFDLFAGLGLGYYVFSSSVQNPEFSANYGSASTFAFNAHIGARYFFNENWSAWAEIGNHLSLISAGAAYKF